MNEHERVELYKKQMTLEEKIVETAQTAVKDMKNVMVRELVLGVAMDSNKHSSLLNALIASIEGKNPLLKEDITDKLKSNLEEHIELEQEAIDSYKTIWNNLEDEKEKMIIKAILNDEIRHHTLLKKIHKMIVEKETITEQELWDMSWKDSLFHGTPGG
jgi:rubrerythrin